MDKIDHQTLDLDAVQEAIRNPADGFYVDVWSIEAGTSMNGPASGGYDDETGLWEELEHRHGLEKILPG